MSNIASDQSWWNSEMANELRSIFYAQYYKQQDALNFLNGKMRTMVNHPTGYSPAALAALRTSAIDSTSREFAHAQQALNAREFAQGGRDLPSGVNAQINAGLGAQQAAEKSNEQSQITLADENMKNQNYWRALSVLGGTAEARNPGGYLSSSLGASEGVAGLVHAANEANQGGFGAKLEGSIASGLGSELTGGNSTGKGGAGFFGF